MQMDPLTHPDCGSVFRHVILSVGHDNLWSGQLGITKTYSQVLKHFLACFAQRRYAFLLLL